MLFRSGRFSKWQQVTRWSYHEDKNPSQINTLKLVGWPKNVKFITPVNLSSVDEVRALIHALKSEECRWVSLSTADIEEHMASIVAREAAGEQIGWKRKQLSDKGMPWKKSAGHTDSSQQQPQQSNRSGQTAKSACTSKFKSREVLSDTDDEPDSCGGSL